jgi:hypothetical protein
MKAIKQLSDVDSELQSAEYLEIAMQQKKGDHELPLLSVA